MLVCFVHNEMINKNIELIIQFFISKNVYCLRSFSNNSIEYIGYTNSTNYAIHGQFLVQFSPGEECINLLAVNFIQII